MKKITKEEENLMENKKGAIAITAKRFVRGVILEDYANSVEIVWSLPTSDGETLFTLNHDSNEAVIIRDAASDVYCAGFNYSALDVYHMGREYANGIRESELITRKHLFVDALDDLLDFDFARFDWAK